jgi:hypothetical protein
MMEVGMRIHPGLTAVTAAVVAVWVVGGFAGAATAQVGRNDGLDAQRQLQLQRQLDQQRRENWQRDQERLRDDGWRQQQDWMQRRNLQQQQDLQRRQQWQPPPQPPRF